MSLSIVNKLILFCLIWGTLLYANNCPKWFPMPSNDGLVVVLPIYDASITASDLDCDGIVDSVDSDIDGDGVANSTDAFPLNSRESIDTDGDGIGNNADNDDDNDGTVDNEDSNPLVNEVPVAHAGDDRQEDINTTIVLDASSSTDDGTILTYSWVLTNKPEGSVATLSNTTSISPSFYGDKVGAYRLELTVSDGILTSIKDVVFVNVGRESTLIAFDDGIHGMEPWITNGTPEGTHLLKDINTKNGSSNIQNMVDAGNVIYFSLNNNELWMSDGTEVGTIRVKRLENAAYIDKLVILNSKLYFVSDGNLWTSDGTEIGTVQISGYFTYVDTLMVSNNSLYFTAKAGNYGRELWRSDGTEAGTIMVKDIYDGDSNPTDLTTVDSLLYFRINNSQNQDELWKSDGTQTGTTLVKLFDVDNYQNIRNFTDVNGTLYFTADDGIHGRELWKSDGTQEGTVMVKDINVGSQSTYPRYLIEVNNTLYFVVNDTIGTQLWKSDGTQDGTVKIKDFYSDSIDDGMVNLNGTLYFRKSSMELWKSDGSEIGTTMVKDGFFGLYALREINGTLYFGTDMLGENNMLWKSDGTTDGTHSIGDIDVTVNLFISSHNRVFFVGNNGIDGNELWISDGTEVGTTMVKNISTNTYASLEYDYKNFIKIGRYYYFVAEDGIYGKQLYRSDGTDVGTVVVANIGHGYHSSSVFSLFSMKEMLYFVENNDINGQQLWKSDGTNSGTQILNTIDAESIEIIASGNQLLYFVVRQYNRVELWKSDGTQLGTKFVKTLNIYMINHVSIVDDFLYFFQGSNLWRSDGTEAGTYMLKEGIANELGNVVFHGFLYFSIPKDLNGHYELWRTDGTLQGTQKISQESDIKNITVVDDILYYTNVHTLWKSDEEFKYQTNVRQLDFYAYDMIAVNDALYFSDSGILWKSNNVVSKVEGIQNIYSVHTLKDLNGELIFRLTDDEPYQLWKTNGTQTIKLTP